MIQLTLFNCSIHGRFFIVVRYMIKVVDHTDSATFVLFDRDAAELFKKTCADMIESRGMGTDASEVPKDILAMVEKSYLFKVETNLGSSTMYEKSYRVKRVTADPVLVEKFQTKYKDLMKNVHEEDVSLVDGVVDGGALKSYIQHYCSGIYRVHSTF
ncbi:putative nucleic acid-binding protein [Medicago truncatula]|uniref:Putative nucleic acid-binding protein n=1 Tax=Medicago truncatula TaxID=3880 RepID=A0A396JK78_MEDTR|nr:putative nucleic acid-binding protein [Medicago truncatula]